MLQSKILILSILRFHLFILFLAEMEGIIKVLFLYVKATCQTKLRALWPTKGVRSLSQRGRSQTHSWQVVEVLSLKFLSEPELFYKSAAHLGRVQRRQRDWTRRWSQRGHLRGRSHQRRRQGCLMKGLNHMLRRRGLWWMQGWSQA